MKPRLALGVCCLALAATLAVRATLSAASPEAPSPAALESAECDGGAPCDAVDRGRLAFHDRALLGLDGNGRSCADCHVPRDNFQLSPAEADRRFKLLQLQRREDPTADDPLFRPIDADDFHVNGNDASDYSNLRENGLVRITFPLPPNLKLIDPATNAPSGELSVDVWRSVPTVNDVALTGSEGVNVWPRGPNQTGGYQLDARFGTLQEQANGAFVTHAQTRNAVPQALLDDLAAFQSTLFTNPRVRALAEAVDAGVVPLPDPDLPLSVLQEQGKAVFVRACAQCHGGVSQTNSPLLPVPIVRYHDIQSQCPRAVDAGNRFSFDACPERLARNARTYEITLPAQFGGAKIRRTSSDPGRALITGFVGGRPPFDDWNKLDMPALRGISKTAPYFHNNSADSLEDVVDHYIEFFKLVKVGLPPGAPIPPIATTDGLTFNRAPLPEERAALLAYLKKL